MLLDMVHVCNPHTWDLEAERLEVRSEHGLCTKALTDMGVPSVCCA